MKASRQYLRWATPSATAKELGGLFSQFRMLRTRTSCRERNRQVINAAVKMAVEGNALSGFCRERQETGNNFVLKLNVVVEAQKTAEILVLGTRRKKRRARD